MIENSWVDVRWNVSNKEHYMDRGYHFTKLKDVFQVKALDLQEKSKVKVTVICETEGCGNKWETRRAIAQKYCRACTVKRQKATWKDDEIAALTDLYSYMEDLAEIAARIGRTENAVQLKASELGLKKAVRKKIIADDPYGFNAASIPEGVAMLFGVFLGDGWISRIEKTVNGKLSYSKSGGISGDVEGLQNIKEDIQRLFPDITLGEIETKKTHSPKYGITGVTNRISIPTALLNHFIQMGHPDKRRAENQFLLPSWLMEGSNEIKSKMISGYYCAEGTCFQMQTNDMTVRAPSFSITQRQYLEQSLNELVKQFSQLLKDLSIEFSIKIVETYTKDKNWKVTFSLANNYENFFRLIKTLDFRYSPYKAEAAKQIFAYYAAKSQIVHRNRFSGRHTKFLVDLSELDEPYRTMVERVVNRFENAKFNRMLPCEFPKFSEFVKEAQTLID